MSNIGGGGAFHQYLRMEMSTGEYGTFTREVMLHVLGQVQTHVPEADQRETLAMLFGSCSDGVKLDDYGRKVSHQARIAPRLQGLQPSQDASAAPPEGNPSS